jgi:ADP-ribose pyrophosphatase YjhB (NUDIX family)
VRTDPSNARVRVIATALIRRQDELLLMAVRDGTGQLKGWRPLGGAVEFGERAADAVKREFIEELAQPIRDLRPLCVLENLFVDDDQPGHEIVYVFDADFEDAAAYDVQQFEFADGTANLVAKWVDLRLFREGRFPLFPDSLLDWL